MASNVYAKDMAKGLFDAAEKKGNLVKWLSELRLLADLLKDPALSGMVGKTDIPFEAKQQALKDRGVELSAEMENLLSVLIEKGKLGSVDSVAIEYQRLMDQHHGIEGSQVASVTTVNPLDDATRLELGKSLSKMAGKPVVIDSRVDPEILGGVIIRIGDKLIDGSIRTKLQTISKELV
ncbi:MAG: ATP synthase F1 subunit delta [Dehalococcoidaceae bacterium]|nr:ATP synthase F1 subunit delta [Dehalococcoidaceae bacterium]